MKRDANPTLGILIDSAHEAGGTVELTRTDLVLKVRGHAYVAGLGAWGNVESAAAALLQKAVAA